MSNTARIRGYFSNRGTNCKGYIISLWVIELPFAGFSFKKEKKHKIKSCLSDSFSWKICRRWAGKNKVNLLAVWADHWFKSKNHWFKSKTKQYFSLFLLRMLPKCKKIRTGGGLHGGFVEIIWAVRGDRGCFFPPSSSSMVLCFGYKLESL